MWKRCLGKCMGGNVRQKSPGELSGGGKCQKTSVRMSESPCSLYMQRLWLFCSTLVNTPTPTRQHRQLLILYTISSAAWVLKKIKMLLSSCQPHEFGYECSVFAWLVSVYKEAESIEVVTLSQSQKKVYVDLWRCTIDWEYFNFHSVDCDLRVGATSTYLCVFFFNQQQDHDNWLTSCQVDTCRASDAETSTSDSGERIKCQHQRQLVLPTPVIPTCQNWLLTSYSDDWWHCYLSNSAFYRPDSFFWGGERADSPPPENWLFPLTWKVTFTTTLLSVS